MIIKEEGTYDNINKKLTRNMRGEVLDALNSKGRGRYVELGGKLAGVAGRFAGSMTNIIFDIVETDPDCIESLNKQKPLQYDNVNIPKSPISLEDYLNNLEEEIDFIDADFRGYASPKTFTFINTIKPQCIPEDGVEVWINVTRQHGRIVDMGLQPSDIGKIRNLLDNCGGDRNNLTRYATLTQVALTDKNTDPRYIFEFNDNLYYKSSSKGDKEAVPMYTIRARIFDKDKHPEKEHKYNTNVIEVGNSKDDRPDKKLDLNKRDFDITYGIPNGYTYKDLIRIVEIAERFKLNFVDLEKKLGLSKHRRSEIMRDFKMIKPDADFSFLNSKKHVPELDLEGITALNYLAFGKEALKQKEDFKYLSDEFIENSIRKENLDAIEKVYIANFNKTGYVPTGRPRGRPRKVVEMAI